MKNALIIAKQQETCDSIGEIIKNIGFLTIANVLSGEEARKKFDETDFDLVIVMTPIADEFGLDLVVALSKRTEAAIIVIVRADIAEEVQDKLEHIGAFVLARPVNKAMLSQTVRFAMIMKNEVRVLQINNIQLMQKLDDMKIIDRAKCCLIEYLRMTESQAHRYIQKQAMDLRVSQRTVAENVLKTYET